MDPKKLNRTERLALRCRAIDQMVKTASENGGCEDRLYWTLTYDFEHAPFTTNVEQLAEIGLVVAESKYILDTEISEVLHILVKKMAELQLFLLHTNHLRDRELYELLTEKILREQVRDLPASDVHEFIDITGTKKAEDIYMSVYASEEDKQEWIRNGGRILVNVWVCQRDQFLPKPGVK